MNTFSTVAGVLGRKLRNFGVAQRPASTFDAYEPTPISREEMSALFELNAHKPLSMSEKLRESERLERQSMERIRGALYDFD